jgi:hypothetical protein
MLTNVKQQEERGLIPQLARLMSALENLGCALGVCLHLQPLFSMHLFSEHLHYSLSLPVQVR